MRDFLDIFDSIFHVINDIRACYSKIKFTNHAKDEMLGEEFGEINPNEVHEALETGIILEHYPEDSPFPTYLVYGKTVKGRHLHVVCAPVVEHKTLVVVTVYEPDPMKWINYHRRIK